MRLYAARVEETRRAYPGGGERARRNPTSTPRTPRSPRGESRDDTHRIFATHALETVKFPRTRAVLAIGQRGGDGAPRNSGHHHVAQRAVVGVPRGGRLVESASGVRVVVGGGGGGVAAAGNSGRRRGGGEPGAFSRARARARARRDRDRDRDRLRWRASKTPRAPRRRSRRTPRRRRCKSVVVDEPAADPSRGSGRDGPGRPGFIHRPRGLRRLGDVREEGRRVVLRRERELHERLERARGPMSGLFASDLARDARPATASRFTCGGRQWTTA